MRGVLGAVSVEGGVISVQIPDGVGTMTMLNRDSLDRYIRSVGVRQIRLACGLVLFAYLLSHFINHALGNISQTCRHSRSWVRHENLKSKAFLRSSAVASELSLTPNLSPAGPVICASET